VTARELTLLLPLLIVAATVVALMVVVSIRRSHRITIGITLAGLMAAFRSLFLARDGDHAVAPLLIIDGYARFFSGLILAATVAIAILSFGYLEQREKRREEYYALMLLATLGALVLVASQHFASLFLGLELLTMSLYALIAYVRARDGSIEASLKYLVLAAASAAFLLFGIALVYAEVGALEFASVTRVPLASLAVSDRVLMLAGLGLIVVGFAFKLAFVPFHLWTPDVYQGAPAPVAAFVATVSKGAVFAVLLRLFGGLDVRGDRPLLLMFTVLAIASMIGGNLLALLQQNLKRLLAYSSIAHLGYLLVAFLATGMQAALAISFYLVAYFITIIGTFGVITTASEGRDELETIEAYRGLAVRRPRVSMVLTLMLLSLAGIPITAGFVSKFYVAAVAADATLWSLLIIMMVTSGIGLFYYLRVIVAIYMQPATETPEAASAFGVARVPIGVLLTALTAALVWLGLYPGPLIKVIQAALAIA
jgi:NADH-quinone oxidoreductase subunit N